MKHCRLASILIFVSFISFTKAGAQRTSVKKYPSLFWEITGKGLKKPSYLFGTMHVSSKMVFHLSDSFYHALKSVDAVALELNPEKWQADMFRMQRAQSNLTKFASAEMADYINEQSFQITRYEDNLRRALNEEPTVVNSLLYRSYQARADFEENTYLDLYIYQTGRKLGKIPSGVEDYEQTEKLMMEAYQDMAKEKTRRTVNTDGESMFDIDKKMQEAYRKGDLDLMDSLETITITSPAFTEKFLYKRNEIQANSIDTILQRRSLFVGVGAAHLPGQRGVIELLRNKGYKLRPIFMQNRDATQKDEVDKLRVPVNFKPSTSEDGFIKMQLPGTLFKREEARINDSWQFADMNNGSYYMITRVRNHAAMLGESEKNVLRKIDSLLYENIPGKILKKTLIEKNGFKGYDITNRTRRGDIQRYNIIATPFEVLVFKMSGNDNYVEGKEAETFFSSIELDKRERSAEWINFKPAQGGFAVKLPHVPNQSLNKKNNDRLDRWEYEAVDEKTGDAYLIWKKTVHNYNFLEEDSFDLSLIEESLKKSVIVEKQLAKKFGQSRGVPFVDVKYALKNGDILKARAYIKGPHYYLLAARSKNKVNEFADFFNSFELVDYKYSAPRTYADSVLNIQVKTPVYPDIDENLRLLVNQATSEEFSGGQTLYSYWPKSKNGLFKSDSTGEAVWVTVETFPKYYYSKDSAKFWKDRLDEKKLRKDMVLQQQEFFRSDDTTVGYNIALTDTNSSRKIKMRYLLKDNTLFRFVAVTDTTEKESQFVNQFLTTVKPLDKKLGNSVFENKLDLFFADYYSADSVMKKRANSAIPNLYFGKEGAERLLKALKELKYSDRDYFETKSRLITELGYIDDSSYAKDIVNNLRELYQKTADTSSFQNAIFSALARLKTKESFSVLKEMLLQDPPVFDNAYEYSRLFNYLDDSLALAKTLFPEILQLAQLEDYKLKLNGLLRTLVDSGLIKSKDYEEYFSKLYFDAKIQLKKQQVKDERTLERLNRQDFVERGPRRNYSPAAPNSNLDDYMVLLMPFYDKKPTIPVFFNKLLQSKDVGVQLEALTLLVKNNKPVSDTIIDFLASKDLYRAKLLNRLEKINRTELFPSKYKKQEDIARSLLLSDKAYESVARVELVKKKYMEHKEKKGYVYFFKYKVKNEDDWQIGISGLQPVNPKEVSSNDELVKMTERKLKSEESVDEQLENQLMRVVFGTHKSSRQFFSNPNYRSFLGGEFDGDDD